MTVDPTKLLQMLEPAVRPGSLSSGGGVQQGKPAFENRPFDELLNEAKVDMAAKNSTGATPPMQTDPLGPLGGLGQVENAALREVLAQARGSESGQGKTGTE